MEVTAFRVVRHTRQFDAMLTFYRDVLEMRAVQSWKRPGNVGALLSPSRAVGQAMIELLDLKERTTRKGRPANVELSLEVRGVDAWHDRLKRQGVRIVDALEDKPWGHRAFAIEDPDGMQISLYEVI